MAAADHLNVEQFDPEEIGHLQSRDYGGRLRDIDFAPGSESDRRVREIMRTAATSGIHTPISVKGTDTSRWLDDGHHRYVAARRLKIPIPVKGYF